MIYQKSLLCISISLLLASASEHVHADDIEHIEIRAERMASDLNSIARNVSVIDEEMLNTQFSSAQNIAEVLAKTVPGMAPPTPALTNFGVCRGLYFGFGNEQGRWCLACVIHA